MIHGDGLFDENQSSFISKRPLLQCVGSHIYIFEYYNPSEHLTASCFHLQKFKVSFGISSRYFPIPENTMLKLLPLSSWHACEGKRIGNLITEMVTGHFDPRLKTSDI